MDTKGKDLTRDQWQDICNEDRYGWSFVHDPYHRPAISWEDEWEQASKSKVPHGHMQLGVFS